MIQHKIFSTRWSGQKVKRIGSCKNATQKMLKNTKFKNLKTQKNSNKKNHPIGPEKKPVPDRQYYRQAL